jgi:hypothetical protein
MAVLNFAKGISMSEFGIHLLCYYFCFGGFVFASGGITSRGAEVGGFVLPLFIIRLWSNI